MESMKFVDGSYQFETEDKHYHANGYLYVTE